MTPKYKISVCVDVGDRVTPELCEPKTMLSATNSCWVSVKASLNMQ